ncbi:hypothetical protein LCGC14_1875270 [marine sediment metagenome]|uniref:DNA polymerase III beta sliding clamp central domain-containing protein n=1 Tax=marine sediment metagenome TaxID=412755 RepID=A0A0F9GRZ5_9ZZZZ
MTTEVETTTETDTETEATTTTIILTSDQAKMLAGLQHAASTDKARPVLCGILLEWTATELTAVATDSYMMARRGFQFDLDGGHPEDEGSILVEAKPFAKALGEAAKVPIGVHMEVVGDKLTINLGGGSVSVFAAIDATFPKWERFYADDPTRHLDGLPALAPHLLEKAIKVAKGTPPVKSDIPFRLGWGTGASPSSDGASVPFRFDLHDQSRGVLSIIVMPVKL